MDETYNVKAITLNRQNYAEDDRRLIVYSRESGKLELIARGTKKIKSKLAGHLEPINLVDLMIVHGQKHDYIGAAVSEKCYSDIKSDLAKLTAAGRAAKIVDQLIKPGVAEAGIFELLKDYYDALETAKKIFETSTSFFIFKLLTHLGHKPELSFCLSCAAKIQPGENRFDLAGGGLVCDKCFNPKEINQLAISSDGIKLFRLALKCNFRQLARAKVDKKLAAETGEVIEKFFKYYF